MIARNTITSNASDRGTRDGFTLLEVLAAVAILSIWFIVIAGTGMQGLRAEGVSRRRLEASMIADRILSDLEASTTDGSAPEPMEETSEQDIYVLSVIVAPFVGADPQAAAPVVNPSAPDSGELALPLDQLIASEMPERSAHLRRIDVRVSWLEGEMEQWVDRTTFAFDLVAARQAYDDAGLQSSAPATPGQGNQPPVPTPPAEDNP